MVTLKLRQHMARLEELRSEHDRQRNCPSRGYDEDKALAEMDTIELAIKDELDVIDAGGIFR